MNKEQIISPALIRLLQKFQFDADRRNDEKDQTKIQVSTTISKIAVVYEKIRNTIDYQEEHLLRKNTIKRILKRRLLNTNQPQALAKPLILELIRAGYLKNNEVPEIYISKIEEILLNYLTIREYLPRIYHEKDLSEINKWFIGIMAVEIEETLMPPIKKDALVELVYDQIKNNIVLTGVNYTEEQKSILLYLSIHKAINKSDAEILNYHLLRFFLPILPTENDEVTEELIIQTVAEFKNLKQTIDWFIHNPINNSLHKTIQKIAVPYMILEDFIEDHADSAYKKLLQTPYLEETVKQIAKKRYKESQNRLHRGAVRSIIYLFITKMLLVLLLEMPLDYYIENQVNYLSLAINVLFPPVLMFLLALIIRVPSKKNTQKILQDIMKIVYSQQPEKLKIKIKGPTKSGSVMNIVFKFFYLILFAISFGLIIYFLRILEFNILSGFIFVLFLCLISFFGTNLRQTAKKYVVLNPRESFLNLILDLISLPILWVGKFISEKLSRFNFFVFVFDFIIEAPFKIVIEVFEEWLSFIREKKEEIAT